MNQIKKDIFHNSVFEKDYKTIKKFLVLLEFENIETSEKLDVWKQSLKSITFQIKTNRKNLNYLRYFTKKIFKIIKNKYTAEELKILLKSLIKKNKILFNRGEKTKFLRIKKIRKNSLESSLLKYLLPEILDSDPMEYFTPIEFTERLKTNIGNEFMKRLDKELKTHLDYFK